MRGSRLVRALTCYDREAESYVGEMILPIPVETLRAMFARPPDDEMMGAYAVGAPQAEALSTLLEVPLDLDGYAYFVEAYEVGED